MRATSRERASRTASATRLRSAWSYDPRDEANPWKSFAPGKVTNDLTQVTPEMGLWLDVTLDGAFTVAGAVPLEVNIPLSPGWNLVGVPTFSALTVADVLAATGAERIEGIDSGSGQLAVLGDADLLLPHTAIWIYTPGEGVWSLILDG